MAKKTPQHVVPRSWDTPGSGLPKRKGGKVRDTDPVIHVRGKRAKTKEESKRKAEIKKIVKKKTQSRQVRKPEPRLGAAPQGGAGRRSPKERPGQVSKRRKHDPEMRKKAIKLRKK